MKTKAPLRRQIADAYEETNVFGRVLATLALILALAALFVFRAATTDPLWETEKAQSQHP